MPDYGYINADIKQEDKEFFQKLVSGICSPSEFYYSNIINYIKGDVTADLHLTIFYGLISQKIDRNKLQHYLKTIHIDALTIGKLQVKYGYKNQYQLLYVDIIDEKKKLAQIADTFKQFPYEKSVQFPVFIPHITLAYLKKDFKLNKSPILPVKITIKGVQYYPK